MTTGIVVLLALYALVSGSVALIGLSLWYDAQPFEKRRTARIVLLAWAWPALAAVAVTKLAGQLLRDAFSPKELR